MATTYVWRNGYPILLDEYGLFNVQFPTSVAKVTYSPEYEIEENINRRLLLKKKGFRVKIEFKIFNTKSMSILDKVFFTSIISGRKMTVWPSYVAGETYDSFLVELTSDVDPKEISDRVDAGQSITLKFESIELEQNISLTADDVETDNIISNTGARFVDDIGNEIIGEV